MWDEGIDMEPLRQIFSLGGLPPHGGFYLWTSGFVRLHLVLKFLPAISIIGAALTVAQRLENLGKGCG